MSVKGIQSFKGCACPSAEPLRERKRQEWVVGAVGCLAVLVNSVVEVCVVLHTQQAAEKKTAARVTPTAEWEAVMEVKRIEADGCGGGCTGRAESWWVWVGGGPGGRGPRKLGPVNVQLVSWTVLGN